MFKEKEGERNSPFYTICIADTYYKTPPTKRSNIRKLYLVWGDENEGLLCASTYKYFSLKPNTIVYGFVRTYILHTHINTLLHKYNINRSLYQ